jgi:1-acyl-sn-glycerol-3-phosphate acyltransferase
MPSAPPPDRPTPWVILRSALQWLVGGAILSVSVAIVLFLGLFLSPFRLDPFLKLFCRTMVAVAGIRVRVHGLENLDPKKTYLFLFNHINIFDHFVMFPAVPHTLRGVEKEVHFRWPIYGTLLRKIGQIPIPPRGDTLRAIASLNKAREMMERGISIAMAPEGTRSATGELQPFKRGAFHLAVQMQATIAPIVLSGFHRINRKGDWKIHPGTVDLYFEKPIPTEGLTGRDVRALSERVHSFYRQRLAEIGTP